MYHVPQVLCILISFTVRLKEQCLLLEESLKKQQLFHSELENDLESCREKNRELLSFSEKLTSLNAELQTTKDSLTIQVVSVKFISLP